MTREQHAITRQHWMKRGILFAASAWLALAVLTSSLLLLDAWRIDRAADAAQNLHRENRAKEARLLASAGGTATLEQRRQSVQTWHSIAALDQNPAPLFQRIQQTARQIGNLHLHRMEWGAGKPGQAAETAAIFSIEGEVAPFDNDFRAAHQRVQNLVNQLKSQLPASQTVSVKRWPLDASTSNELEGEFGHSQVGARFLIEITGLPSGSPK